MKKLILATLLVSTSVFAAPVKTCETAMEGINTPKIPTLIEVFVKGREAGAKVTQIVNRQTFVSTEPVIIEEFRVRSGLRLDSNPEILNDGEKLIVRAMDVEEDRNFQGKFKSGVDLKLVRSVKLYRVGEDTSTGTTTIIEAKNQKREDLGSFLGGVLLFPCK